MSIKVQGDVVITDDKKGVFDQVNPGVYTTVQRDALSPAVGDIVFNSEDEELQVWNGTDWGSAGSGNGSIGSPVEVLTPTDGAGVGGAVNYQAKTDLITSTEEGLHYGGRRFSSDMNITSSQGKALSIVEAENGRVVALSENDGITYTDNGGLTWTKVTTPSDGWQKLLYEPVTGNLVIVGDRADNNTAYSTDNGETWNQGTQISGSFYDAATNGTGRIVATGQMRTQSASPRWYSDNGGASWSSCSKTSQNSNLNQYRPSIAYGNGRWASGCDWSSNGSRSASPEYSSNGINWSISSASTNHASTCIIWCDDKNLFVDLGTRGDNTGIGYSSNGSTWTYKQADTSGTWYPYTHNSALVYGNGLWILTTSSQYGFRYTTDIAGSWSLGYLPRDYDYDRFSGGDFVGGTFWMSDTYASQALYKGLPGTSYAQVPAWAPSSGNNWDINKKYTAYFASTDVFNKDTDVLLPDADFATTFNRQLKSSNETLTFTPNQVGDGFVTYTVTNLANDTGFNPGGYMYTNSTLTEYGPSPTDVEFTSMNAGTAPFNGTDASLAYRTWTLDTRASDSDPWTNVTIADDYDPVASQDGATPWSGKPTLTADTQYRVKVEYSSDNARSVESEYSYFTTGPS